MQAVQGQVMVAVNINALGGEFEEHLFVQISDIGFVEFQSFENAFHIDRPEHILQGSVVHFGPKTFQFFGVVVHSTRRDHGRFNLIWFDYFDLCLARLWLKIAVLHLIAQNRSGGRLYGRRLIADVQSVEVWFLIVAAWKVVRIAEIQILATGIQDQEQQCFDENCLRRC